MIPSDRLSLLLKSGKIPHALLFSGPNGGEKKEAAYKFATDLLSTKKKAETHPDIHHFFPEGKTGMHPLSSIRQLSDDAALAPFEGKWKVFILHQAEKMLPTSSNALLKTLEEPTPHTLIILISDYPERLLPTIHSRCQTIEFPPGKKRDADPTLLACLAGDVSKEQLLKLEVEDHEALFETVLFWYRDRLLLEIGGCDEWLHFPEHRDQVAKTSLISLERVEKEVAQARLAAERSTKLSLCFEMLFLSLRVCSQTQK